MYILVFLSSTRSCVLELTARFQDGHKLYIYFMYHIYIVHLYCISMYSRLASQINELYLSFRAVFYYPSLSSILLLFFLNLFLSFFAAQNRICLFKKKRTNNFLSLFFFITSSESYSRLARMPSRMAWRNAKTNKKRSKEINNTNKAQHALQSRKSGCLFRSIQHTHTYIRLHVHFVLLFFFFFFHSPSLKARKMHLKTHLCCPTRVRDPRLDSRIRRQVKRVSKRSWSKRSK